MQAASIPEKVPKHGNYGWIGSAKTASVVRQRKRRAITNENGYITKKGYQ